MFDCRQEIHQLRNISIKYVSGNSNNRSACSIRIANNNDQLIQRLYSCITSLSNKIRKYSFRFDRTQFRKTKINRWLLSLPQVAVQSSFSAALFSRNIWLLKMPGLFLKRVVFQLAGSHGKSVTFLKSYRPNNLDTESKGGLSLSTSIIYILLYTVIISIIHILIHYHSGIQT